MRIIHMSAENGRWEAVVFTEEEGLPEDFAGRDSGREGFAVDFDEHVEMPVGFLPSESDIYLKEGL